MATNKRPHPWPSFEMHRCAMLLRMRAEALLEVFQTIAKSHNELKLRGLDTDARIGALGKLKFATCARPGNRAGIFYG